MKIVDFLTNLLTFIVFFDSYSQKLLSLNSEKLHFTPTFRIDEIKDKRSQQQLLSNEISSIGSVFNSLNEKETIGLKGGVPAAIGRMFAQMMPLNKAAISVAYHILELKISESKLPNGTITGQMSLRVAFNRLGKKDTVLLTETNTATTFVRFDGKMPIGKYEETLITLFAKSLEYFEKWLTLNGGKHEALIKGMKIVFLPEKTTNDDDTIYYQTRKINWDDFRGKPTNSHFGAAIFANFAYGSTFQIIDGFIVATIQTQTYMVRGMSWVIPAAHNEYSLAHEQLHFDIAKLVTERFKKKIALMKADLIIDLNSMIQYEYLESYREMNQLQNQYDTETNHSINRSMQIDWEKKVKNWLDNS